MIKFAVITKAFRQACATLAILSLAACGEMRPEIAKPAKELVLIVVGELLNEVLR